MNHGSAKQAQLMINCFGIAQICVDSSPPFGGDEPTVCHIFSIG